MSSTSKSWMDRGGFSEADLAAFDAIDETPPPPTLDPPAIKLICDVSAVVRIHRAPNTIHEQFRGDGKSVPLIGAWLFQWTFELGGKAYTLTLGTEDEEQNDG